MINRVPLERIHLARSALFEAAEADGRSMAFAVVDEAGGLIFAERMERCDARVLTHATRKAYTSAIMHRSTLSFRDRNLERGKTLADWGDPILTQLLGGVAIRIDDEWFGGLAVGGHTASRDVALAELALAVLLGTTP